MIQFVAASVLVGWLPGAVLMRLPGKSRAYRAMLPADERLFWAVLLSVVWSVMVVLALGGLGQYSFPRLLMVNGGAAALALLLWRQRLRFPAPVGGLSWSAALPVAVIAIGVSVYFPPAEYAIGGRDPGTYLNEGIQIAQTGRVIVRDESIALVPPPFRDLFFPSHNVDTYYGLRFMGFFIQDPQAGLVVGQFPHLYPASIAIAYGFDGLTGARSVIGVWAMLGIVAVYFAGAQIFGRAAAAAAALLLAINVVTVWFARYPNSELPMQALLFAALLAGARARSGGGLFFAVVSGALLGLTLFLRYEVLIAIAAFASVAILAPVTRERFGLGFALALAITSAAGLWYLVDPMRAYSAYPLGFIRNRGGWMLLGAGLVAAVAANRVLRLSAITPLVRRTLPVALAIAVPALAIYAYFFRQEGGRTALGDAIAFRSFGWYVLPGGLILAVAGAAVLIWRHFWRAPLFFTTFLAFSTFFFYKTRIVPEHFWTSRRFLGMALPGALLLATALVRETLSEPVIRRAAARVRPISTRVAEGLSIGILVAVTTPLALAYWAAAAPVRHHVEYAGLIPRLETLASRIGDRDLLIVESRNAGSDIHVLAMPMAYVYARHVLLLDSRAPDRRTFEQFVAWARTTFDNVLFLGGGGTDLLTREIAAVPVASDRFQVPEYDAPLNRYPSGIHAKEFEYGLYRLTRAASVARGPIDLAIGGLDDLNVVRFGAREVRGDTGVAFRWSRDRSDILLTGLSPEARRLTIWLSDGGRPPQAPPATVDLTLGDTQLGTARPRDAIEPFVFAIPPTLARSLAASGDPVRLQIRVPTWKPSAVVGGPDTRDLGVLVTRVVVE